VSYVVSGHM